MICVENLCVLRAKEKLNEPSTLHACIVLQDSAWSACRSVCEGGWATGVPPTVQQLAVAGRGRGLWWTGETSGRWVGKLTQGLSAHRALSPLSFYTLGALESS